MYDVRELTILLWQQVAKLATNTTSYLNCKWHLQISNITEIMILARSGDTRWNKKSLIIYREIKQLCTRQCRAWLLWSKKGRFKIAKSASMVQWIALYMSSGEVVYTIYHRDIIFNNSHYKNIYWQRSLSISVYNLTQSKKLGNQIQLNLSCFLSLNRNKEQTK